MEPRKLSECGAGKKNLLATQPGNTAIHIQPALVVLSHW